MKMKKRTFESAMSDLEEIVKKLESGALPLEDSLCAFEEAVALVKYCNGELDAAKQRVRILTESEDGTVTDCPFDIDET